MPLLQYGYWVTKEIYQYRCRVLYYQPRKSNDMDIEDRVEELCDNPPSTADLATLAALKKRQKKAEAAAPKGTTRRGTFSAALAQINSDATGSDVRADYLSMPPASAMTKLQANLYDWDKVFASYKARNSSASYLCCSRLCNPCRRSSAKVLDEEGPWSQVGSDFHPNPFAIDDDYLNDDGTSLVTAEDYIHFRFLPMLQYYSWRSRDLSRKVLVLQVLTYFLTAALAAATPLGYEAWPTCYSPVP